MNKTEKKNSFCHIPHPKIIYCGPRTWDEFELIQLPMVEGEWHECKATTLIKNDGRTWERRIMSKTHGDYSGLTVVFQWSEVRPVGGW